MTRLCTTCGGAIPSLAHGNTRYCSPSCRPYVPASAKAGPSTGYCRNCNAPLTPNEGEDYHHFLLRRHCNRSCAKSASLAVHGARVGAAVRRHLARRLDELLGPIPAEGRRGA